jgi:hypothetical protein
METKISIESEKEGVTTFPGCWSRYIVTRPANIDDFALQSRYKAVTSRNITRNIQVAEGIGKGRPPACIAPDKPDNGSHLQRTHRKGLPNLADFTLRVTPLSSPSASLCVLWVLLRPNYFLQDERGPVEVGGGPRIKRICTNISALHRTQLSGAPGHRPFQGYSGPVCRSVNLLVSASGPPSPPGLCSLPARD